MLTEAQKAEIRWLMANWQRRLPDDWMERDKKLSDEVGRENWKLIWDFMDAHPELRHESRQH